MFSYISKIIRILFLIVWTPTIIICSPIFIIFGMAMQENWDSIITMLYDLALLKI